MAALKRHLLNLAGLLVILAVGFGASRLYNPDPFDLGVEGVELPRLSAFDPVDVVFDLDNARISFALELKSTATQGPIVADILELYRWSRQHYRPVKCGDEYPPELCKYGTTQIWVLQRGQVTVVGGVAEAYQVIWAMGLDQEQIDQLLNSIPPATVSELDQFHQRAAQSTDGTGGFSQFVNPPAPFQGLPR